MDIEIVHNPVKLPACRHYKAKNGRKIEHLLAKYCEERLDRGYTLRFVYSDDKGILELADRRWMNVNMAESYLLRRGIELEPVRWSNVFTKQLEVHKWH